MKNITPIGNLKAIKATLVFFITLQYLYACDKTLLIIEQLFVLRFQSREVICAILESGAIVRELANGTRTPLPASAVASVNLKQDTLLANISLLYFKNK